MPRITKKAPSGVLTEYIIRLTGIKKMLVSNPQTVDPYVEITQHLKRLQGKRQRSEEQQRELDRVQWEAGLYFDPERGPVLPQRNVIRAIEEGAKSFRGGPYIRKFVNLGVEEFAPIQYDGPRQLDAMYADGRFKDRRDVGIQKKRVMVERPCFPAGWTLDVEFAADHAQFDEHILTRALDYAGKYVGIGTARLLGFGRFTWAEISRHEIAPPADMVIIEDDDEEGSDDE